MNNTQITYKELQAMAGEAGLKMNQSAEKLFDLLTRLGYIDENNVVIQEEEPKANPFAGFFADNRSQKQQTAQEVVRNAQQNYVSPNLMKFAKDLYRTHKLNDDALDTMTWQEVKAEVDRLQALPQPMSPAQEETLFKVLGELTELGCPVEIPSAVMKQLTGGREGSASQLIEKLFAKRFEAQQNAPLSDAQADILITWFLCPDIPFENFNIVKKAMLPEISEVAWRFITCDEFKEQLRENMTRSQASQFIDEYRGVYFDWKKTRCSTQQKNYIRQLEERMANLSSPRKVEYAIVDGKVEQVVTRQQREYNPQAYTALSDFDLEQMSYDDASRFIDQLKSELARPKRSTLPNTNDQQLLEEKHNKFSERTGNGRAHDKETYRIREHRKLSDFIFRLEAVVNYTNEDLHETMHELMVEGVGDVTKASDDLLAFINEALNLKAIGFSNLVNLASESTVVTQLLELNFPKQYNEAVGGKTDQFVEETVEVKQEEAGVTDFINNL